MGREVRLEQRRATNRTVLLAVGGIALLCVCLLLAGSGLGLAAQNGRLGAISLPLIANSTSTPTAAAGATPVPLGRSATNGSGLRVTVTAYQRPLPFQEIQVPDGQELVLVTVRLDNTRKTGGPIKYAQSDFSLVSPEGDSFQADTGQVTTGSLLKAGELAPGKSTTGDVVFFVYSDVQTLMLSWLGPDGSSRLLRLTR